MDTIKLYCLDKDELGIRESTAKAIRGAILSGARDESPPSKNHWLYDFYTIGSLILSLRLSQEVETLVRENINKEILGKVFGEYISRMGEE